MRTILTLFILVLGMTLAAPEVQAQEATGQDIRQVVRLKSGKSWRGQIGDTIKVDWKRGPSRPTMTGRLDEIARLYIKVTPEGGDKAQVLLLDSITSITTIAETEDVGTPSTVTGTGTDDSSGNDEASTTEAKQPASKGKKGIFILPLSGTVGIEFRPEEIQEITRQADERGEGQIIVLEIDSGGGLVAEGMIIKEAIFDASKRHTVVAWIDHAISGASWTALCCDLIIFKRHGHTGGITIMIGNQTAPDETVNAWIPEIEKLLIEKGRSKYWARPFVVQESYLSATKDPETGEVKWYPDLSGDRIFSAPGQNLMFNAPEAVEYGFAHGIANTHEELAEVLQIKDWELDGNGQELHDLRYELKERFQDSIQKDQYHLGRLGNSPADINKRIKIFESWLLWWKKVPNQMRMSGMPSKEQIKELIEQQKYLLRQMAEGGGGRGGGGGTGSRGGGGR